MNLDDQLWKSVLEDLFKDFLCFFFRDAEQTFDLEKGVVFLDKELTAVVVDEEMGGSKEVDKLVKVYTRSGEEEWVLLHLEVQGYRDERFEERMYTYFYRIREKYRKPVIAVAILTGGNKNYFPEKYEYACWGTSLTYKFNTYKIIEQEEAALWKHPNPFSIVILTVLLAFKWRRTGDEELLRHKLQIVRNLLQRSLPPVKMKALMTFIKLYVRFEDKRYYREMDDQILEITKNRKTMGIVEFVLDRAKKEARKEGKIEGEQEKTHEFVISLLRNTDWPMTKIASLAGVSRYYVGRVRKEIGMETLGPVTKKMAG